MDSKNITLETWNKVATLYQEKFMDLRLYDYTYDAICETVDKKYGKILDIGCGPGNITKYLLNKRPDFDIMGIDYAPNMIALASKNNPSATFAVMDCSQILEIKSTFNAIVCGFCLPYISEKESQKLIADCHHLLSENGLLYLSFVEGDPDASDFQLGSTGDAVFFYLHDLNSIKKTLVDHGFVDLKIYYVNYNKTECQIEKHTILMAKKK